MQRKLVSCIVLMILFTRVFAQDETSIRHYIDQYKLLAMAEQKRSGIPASIILAQGIHETQAGGSELATQANNHFGIKCKKEWTGETFAHTDDAPNECFRKYKRAEDSYIDHSNYLSKTPRYASLFKLSVTDYAGWAFGLKQCGYATNPKYARVLIQLVEDYHLQQFTYDAMENNIASKYAVPTEVVPEHDAPAQNKTATNNLNAEGTPVIAILDEGTTVVPANTPSTVAATAASNEPVATANVPVVNIPANDKPNPDTNTPIAETQEPIPSVNTPIHDSNITTTTTEQKTTEPAHGMPPYGKVVKVNNLKAVYAKKGDMPLEYAIKNNLRYERFLEINEIDERPLPMDMFLYLERKSFRGAKPTHVVKEGETMFSIAQAEGMQIKNLRTFNMMLQGEPEPGTVLELQKPVTRKPVVSNKPISSKQMGQPNPPAPPVEEVASTPIEDLSPQTNTSGTKNIEVPKHEEPAPVEVTKVPEETKTVPAPAPEIVAGGDKAQPTVDKEPATLTAPIIESTPEIATNTPVETKEKPGVVGPPSSPNDIPAKPVETPKTTPPVAKTITPPVKTQVAEPVAPEEPKTELDVLKSKFDKVVYQKPKPAETTAPKETPKAEESKPVAKEPVTASASPKYYIVKKGDTAFSIAKANNITMRQLMDLNGLDFAEIKVGQKLRVQ